MLTAKFVQAFAHPELDAFQLMIDCNYSFEAPHSELECGRAYEEALSPPVPAFELPSDLPCQLFRYLPNPVGEA